MCLTPNPHVSVHEWLIFPQFLLAFTRTMLSLNPLDFHVPQSSIKHIGISFQTNHRKKAPKIRCKNLIAEFLTKNDHPSHTMPNLHRCLGILGILGCLGCPAQFKVWGCSLPSDSSYSSKAFRKTSTASKRGEKKHETSKPPV